MMMIVMKDWWRWRRTLEWSESDEETMATMATMRGGWRDLKEGGKWWEGRDIMLWVLIREI